MSDPIDYQRLMDDALRTVVRGALKTCAHGGLPPGHYFYLSFKTQAPGVEMAPELVARYPDVMTIVLQHQFWDLQVTDEGFAVGLSFSSTPHRLEIPFSAVIAFADPPAEFGLRFGPPDGVEGAEDGEEAAGFGPKRRRPSPRRPPAVDGDEDDDGPQAEVVSIEAFRKR